MAYKILKLLKIKTKSKRTILIFFSSIQYKPYQVKRQSLFANAVCPTPANSLKLKFEGT